MLLHLGCRIEKSLKNCHPLTKEYTYGGDTYESDDSFWTA